MRIELIEPPARGHSSGGYLYNAKLAEHATGVRRHAAAPEALTEVLASLQPDRETWLVADSLFLDQPGLEPFFEQQRVTNCKLACLLHALPSFIERAQSRARVAHEAFLPSPSECSQLGALDLVIAPGPYLPELLRAVGSSVPCAICPPGLDATPPPHTNLSPHSTLPQRAPLPARSAQLISVAAVTPNKGLSDAARALAQLQELPWTWTIVGNLELHPAYVNELRELLQQLGITQRVRLTGALPHAETLRRLRENDLFILPSYTENHPLGVMEAIALGVPVVGYAAGGVVNLVQEHGAGALSPLLDEADLARQLHRLLTDSSAYEAARQACAMRSAGWPSWAEAARDFEETLRSRTSAVVWG